jgi:hypothetical protein
MPRKRTYLLRKYYAVICSECNEDISDDSPLTKAEAEEIRDIHEAWHQRDEKRAARN